MINVFNGVNEFSVELIELLIWVCANANKKIGKKLPNNPAKIMYLIFFFLMWNNSFPAIANKKSEVKTILYAPS